MPACAQLSLAALPLTVLGEGRAAGGPLKFLVVSLGSVGCIPCTPRGPACHASHAGLLCSWKAADSLGSALTDPSAWLETPLILSQHRHSQAAQPQMHPIQMVLDEALWKMVRDLLEAALALQTRLGERLFLAREVPAVNGAGWTGAVLCIRAGNQTTFSCTRVARLCRGSDPREDLVSPLGWEWEPSLGYSPFPLAVLRGKAVLSWLCCTLGGSPASWRAALPCCREAKYICLATNQGAVSSPAAAMGWGREAAQQCLGRTGQGWGWGQGHGKAVQALGMAGIWPGMARAGNPQPVLPPFPPPDHFVRNWGRDEAAGSWLLALFPAIYQAPLLALFFLHSFVSATALMCIYSQSDSIPLCQGCLSLDPCGDLASLLPDWALSALPRALPGLWQDRWGTAQPFAETQLQQLRFLLLNKPPPGSSTDVRLWKYLCEGLGLARCGQRHRNWEERCSLPILRKCAHLWPVPAPLSGHGAQLRAETRCLWGVAALEP